MVGKQLEIYARQQWVSACTFESCDEKQLLEQISQALEKPSNGCKFVLLDLDSTLYEVAHRTHQIVMEWLALHRTKLHAETTAALSRIATEQYGYSLRDTFTNVSLDLSTSDIEKDWKSAREYWFAHFFTERLLPLDRPYPGTVQFARRLWEKGATLVYLTGRSEPDMGKNTRANLLRDGFPMDPQTTRLLMKPQAELPDMEHKRQSVARLLSEGEIIASFENEPKNLVAMKEISPGGFHVFVDTVCSDHPAKAVHGLFRLSSFIHS